MGKANQFLGIKIIRDRPNKKLWICQDNYIKKIAYKFNLISMKSPKTPLLSKSLIINNKYQASNKLIYQYQQKVGLLLYAIVITRPDVAKAAQLLSEYLTNPHEKHINAVNHAISYLYGTKYLAIEYSGQYTRNPIFICASDASFADSLQRKSSKGYICKLFNGPINWQAKKQKTIITSITEAELLALSNAAKQIF
jgi:hypothetical protein